MRDKADQGHILATTLDYPMVLDTVGCTPEFLKANPDAAKALADSYFEALDLIKKDPQKSNEIMGADVKQSAKEFERFGQIPAMGRQGREQDSSSPRNSRISPRPPATCCCRWG